MSKPKWMHELNKAVAGDIERAKTDQRTTMVFTRFRNEAGDMAKQFELLPSGKVEKTSAAEMWRGSAETVSCGLAELPGVIASLKTNEALGLGVCGRSKTKIVTERAAAKNPDAISRTKKHFSMPSGLALGFIDSDVCREPETLIAAIAGVFPAFARCAKIVMRSSSAGIYRTGEDVPAYDGGGLHVYFSVKDGADFVRFGDALCKRLWLGGHGHIVISASGIPLVRQIADATTFAPERIVFEAQPILGPGLERRPPPPLILDGEVLDTSACFSLTAGENAQYNKLVAEAKRAKQPEAKPIRDAYLLKRGQEIADAGEVSLVEAIKLVEKAVDGQPLQGDFPLHFKRHGRATVAEVLGNLEKYDGQILHDPLEPDYTSRFCAIFFANLGYDPCVFSQAHGGRRFPLAQPEEPVETDEKPNPLAGRKSLAELAETPIDPELTLLGNRFLCRRGAMLYVGRAGLGKSSSSAQQDVSWALGREAFGILPAKPLNILCVQAENDEGDLHEMGAGVLNGLGLNEGEVAQVNSRTTYVQWFDSGDKFLAKLRDALTAERDAGRPFDLVRIDPLLAFAGGDLVRPEVVASFCRSGLNSIAFDFDCGIIAVHHTPKLNLTARPRMDGPEWIYAATGCADLSNWARAILVIADSPNAMPGTFRLIGAKRGKRITWRDTDGEMEFERYFSHEENRGGMFWRAATPEETEVATARAEKDKKPTALQEIAAMEPSTMEAHASNILRKGPMVAADFIGGVMKEFRINERYAKTVAKWLTEGDGKPVKVRAIGKNKWHGTAAQLDALQSPAIKGLK